MDRSASDIKSTASPKRSVSRMLTIVLFAVASTPLVIECASLYYAKWSTIMGKSANVRTRSWTSSTTLR